MKDVTTGIFFDDEEKRRLTPITDLLSKRFNFEIEIAQPEPWDDPFIARLARLSKSKDCIILDWRLDEHVLDSGKHATYKAAEICQLIRRKTAEGEFRPVPIFLWSTDQNLGHSYRDDFTSHDLFDRIYKKDKDLKGPLLNISGQEMLYFVHLYKFLRRLKTRPYTETHLNLILGLDKSNKHWIDISAIDYFLAKTAKTNNISKIALASKIIFHAIINRSGVLVNEDLLAIRLGINKEKSIDWSKLISKNEFSYITFSGFFQNKETPRFWMQGLYELWENINKNGKSLLMTRAEDRVEILLKKFKLKQLTPLKGVGENFWYAAHSDGRPLDPNFAKQVLVKDIHAWQDHEYDI